MDNSYDCIIVGAGPSGIFAALELIGSGIRILMVEQGLSLEKRRCPIDELKKCIDCKPFCNITCGFSGAGAFSDGKLSLYDESQADIYVGGELHKIIGVPETKALIDYTDGVYLKYGAERHVHGRENSEWVKNAAKTAEQNDVSLIRVPIRHLGTEKSREIFMRLEKHIIDSGVVLKTGTVVDEFIIEDGRVLGVTITENGNTANYYSDTVISAVGRKGANWMSGMCAKYGIANEAGVIDIGVRYELPDSIMREVNEHIYEGKFIAKPAPFHDKVRTFCQNPSGYVSAEVYDKGIRVVNGHSYKNKKSEYTNLAILVSHKFKVPFNQPIKFGRNIAMNTNDLGNNQILVQRLGCVKNGKRSWESDIEGNSVKKTLKSAIAGDITAALPYRTMCGILGFIEMIDKVVPGFADKDNLLYAPEIKFYSNKIILDKNLETNIKGLYCIGDTGGLTRGLMHASCSGVYAARRIRRAFVGEN